MKSGDKFVVTKNISNCFISRFLNEGEIVEVKNVTEDNLVSFEFSKENMQMNFTMDSDTFNKCFEPTNDSSIREVYNNIVELVERIMEDSEFETITMFDSITVVSCKLPNGFVIVVDDYDTKYYGDYDKEHAEEICFDKIADKILELETYRIASIGDCNRCDCDCYCDEDNCDDCIGDGDADCEYCEDYDCEFNQNYRS